MSPSRTLSRITTFVALAALTLSTPLFSQPANAQDDAPVRASGNQGVLDTKIQLIRDEYKERRMEAKEMRERARRARHAHGKKVQLVLGDDDYVPVTMTRQQMSPFNVLNTLVVPTNTKTNDKTLDAAGAGQAEQHLAFIGDNGLCAWNDGQGFNSTPVGDVQGWGYTTNGGATWIDGGTPPRTAAITTWTSDPVVGVNEKTGDFYYCGLTSNPSSTNGVGVLRGNFSGGSFVWQPSVVTISGSNSTEAYDKQWMCADSSTGNLYLTYTKFVVGGNAIWFQRSINNGLTWSVPLQISSAADNGLVQGSRPCVGPNGELYVVYYAIGTVSDYDYMKVRKSTNGGVSFGAEVIAASLLSNFGTGAPGFNRERGLTMPGIACDRSTGPNRGRLYVTYNETVEWYVDLLGGGGAKSEVENNGNFANATPFTIGQTIRGVQTLASDSDYWKFSAVQGTTYIFWVDSLRSTLRYTLRVYCPNDTIAVSRVAMGGNASTAGQQGFVVWTAPSTADYFLRWTPVAGTSAGYRIRTGVHTANILDVARDQRDAMVVASNDGITWGLPTRMNDDLPLYDNWLPEVAVPCDGNVYGMWMDFRDAPGSCAGGSNIYVTRSTNGGATWAPNLVATSAPTPNWTQVLSNIAPNQGDYNGMYGGDALGLAWADGRLGDPDVFAARVRIGFSTFCGNDTTVLANSILNVSYPVTNDNGMFANTADYTLTVDRNWPGLPASGSLTLAELATGLASFGIAIPDTAANGDVKLCFTVSCAGGACVKTCCRTLNVLNIATPTLAALINATADANGAKLLWSVSSSLPVHVYRAADGGAWDLVATVIPDGDGRVAYDDAGVVRGARYGYRLGVAQNGREVPAGETWLTIPARAMFALHGGRPNPTNGPLSISFSLMDDSPATLELIDLNGRRVFESSVGHLGAGYHVVPMDGGVRLPVGFYMIRLTQNHQTLNSKISIVR